MGIAVLINGPSGSGKDEAARALCARFSAFHYKLSHPLKVAIPALLGIEDRKIELENNRDEKMPVLFGKSFRELQIDLYQKFIVPVLGEEALVSIGMQNIKGHIGPGRMVVLDVGMPYEAVPFTRLVGKKNVLIIQLMRDGYTFNDYRTYVEAPGIEMIQLHNKYDLESFKAQVVRAVERWLDQNKGPR